MTKVAAKAFRNGSLNPNAWRQQPISEEQIRESRLLNHPLTQYMLCSPDEGAAAVVVCRAEDAHRYTSGPGLRAGRGRAHPPVRHLRGVQPVGVHRDRTESPTVDASRAVYEMAGIGPGDVQVAQIQDSESGRRDHAHGRERLLRRRRAGADDLRRRDRDRGAAPDQHRRRACSPTASPSVPPGMRQIHEIVLQLRGDAGPRQVPGGPDRRLHTGVRRARHRRLHDPHPLTTWSTSRDESLHRWRRGLPPPAPPRPGGRGHRARHPFRRLVRRGRHLDGRRGRPPRRRRGPQGRHRLPWCSPPRPRPTPTAPTPPPSTRPSTSTRPWRPTTRSAPCARTVGALRAAADAAAAGRTTLLVAADVRVGLPGSADERDGGDGAAAVVFGPAPPAAGRARGRRRRRRPSSSTAGGCRATPPRRCGRSASARRSTCRSPRPRFGDALKAAGLTAGDVDHLDRHRAPHPGRRRGPQGAPGPGPRRSSTTCWASIGITGAAHPLLLLTDVLERADARPGRGPPRAGRRRRLPRLPHGRGGRRAPPAGRWPAQLAGRPVDHTDVLVWRGLLKREPPRRPDPDRPGGAAVEPQRGVEVRPRRLPLHGVRHPPPAARSACASRAARRTTWSASRSPTCRARSPRSPSTTSRSRVAPPVVAAVVDFDGGGRIQCELADVDRRRGRHRRSRAR